MICLNFILCGICIQCAITHLINGRILLFVIGLCLAAANFYFGRRLHAL
jgi:hypothetical protein